MSDNETNDTPHALETEYKGPDKFTAALGKGLSEAAVVSVAAGTAGAVIGAMIGRKTPLKRAEHVITGRWAGARVGTEVGAIGGLFAGLAHGAHKGASNVSAACEQVSALCDTLDKTRLELDKEKTYTQKLREQAASAAPSKSPTP